MAKKKKRLKDKRAFKFKLKPATAFSIVQIIFFSLAALIIISFARQGLILIRLNDFLLTYFSWATIFLPFIFLSFGLLVSKFKTPLGQPNVIVGFLLFFVSILTLFRAGILGLVAWGGVAALITGVGAGIVLFGTSVVGLIILFNTSIDQVISFFETVYKQYVVRDTSGRKTFGVLGKKPLRVFGETNFGSSKPATVGVAVKPAVSQTLEQKLVSNMPGETKVWKYPDMDILTDTVSGKAERGDIKGNAATIEQTLESFGIQARVVEVNLGPAVTQYA